MATTTTQTFIDPLEREAALGLWSIPGIGAGTLEALALENGGSLLPLLDSPVSGWVDQLPLREVSRSWLQGVPTLRELASWVRERAQEAGISLSWRGEFDYPENLATIHDPPPLLFRLGEVGVRRRRVALVGSRQPDGGFLTYARRLAKDIAQAGVGVISGAAIGVDKACHLGALDAGGETWAFLGSALDQVDPAQRPVVDAILEGGGTVFSEMPPGFRANKTTFPLRNRLISGSADAVVILRGESKSGTLHTARHAYRQGRRLLAVPGDPWIAQAEGPNGLLKAKQATVCTCAQDVFEAVGLAADRLGATAPPGRPLSKLGLSEHARRALAALEPYKVRGLEEVLGSSGLEPVQGVLALAELEASGLLVQHPGRSYERV